MKVYVLLISLIISLSGLSQQLGKIVFSDKIIDLGTIQEENGKQTIIYHFRNDAKFPLKIEKVESFCGCTKVEWPLNTIKPGGTSSVSVQFNPIGRSGFFEKEILVYSNSLHEMEVLSLKGNIVPKTSEKGPKESKGLKGLKVNMDSLLLGKSGVQFGNIEKGSTQFDSIRIFNSGSIPMKLDYVNLPAYLTLKTNPDTLLPNQEGFLKFELNSALCSFWGEINRNIQIRVNKETHIPASRNLHVRALIIDRDSSNATLFIPKEYYKLGKLRPGQNKKISIVLNSTGSETLYVRKLICNIPEIEVISYPEKIKHGKKAKMVIQIMNGKTPGKEYNRSITLQTNDSENPQKLILFHWETKSKKSPSK